MTIFKSIDYNLREVSALATDTNSGEYLWVAFKQNSDGDCIVKKVSAHDVSAVYFSFELAVMEVTRIILSGSTYVLLAVNDDTNYIYRYGLFTPLTTETAFTKPVGLTEYPVDVASGGGFFWWLFPGTDDGENAAIVKTTDDGTFSETIDLSISGDIVYDATGITYKSGDLWIVTNSNPVQLWRVYKDSTWHANKTDL